MSSGRETGEDALLGEEERPSANGKQCTLAGRVLLLELGVFVDKRKRLRFILENVAGVTANDNENVEVVEPLIGLLPVELGLDDNTLLREDLGLARSDGDLKGLGGCFDTAEVSILFWSPCDTAPKSRGGREGVVRGHHRQKTR